MDAALEIARRIADGEPVDWTTVERDPELAGRLSGFKALEAVASVRRESADHPPGTQAQSAGGGTAGWSGTPAGGSTPSHGISESHPEIHLETTTTQEGAGPPGLSSRAGASQSGVLLSDTERRDGVPETGGEGSAPQVPSGRTDSIPGATIRGGETGVAPGGDRPAGGAATLERWGHLRIRERIGRGGFGEVYRAHDAMLDKECALKLLSGERGRDPREVDRFISEARRHARVSHRSIVAIHGADLHEGRVGLWMDLVNGKTLEQLLEAQGRFGAEEAAQVGLEICGAIAAVHAERLVHRDVKTGNIMRREGGGYVLMDFSASVERPDRGALNGSAPATGTPLFMAPEIFQGAPAGPQSDIYSLGVVLYRLVSGLFPVPASDISELREKHARKESVPLRDVRPDLPGGFVRIVERALSHTAGDRYRTAGEFEKALVACQNPVPPQVPEPQPLPHERAVGLLGGDESHRRSDPWWTRVWNDHPHGAKVATAALLVVVAGIAGYGLWPGTWLAPDRPGSEVSKARIQGPLHVDAALYLATGGSPRRLFTGDSVRPEDQLYLQLETSQAAHVYVLNEDARGHSVVIYPLEFLDTRNPIPPGEMHRLPGTAGGEPYYWDVTSAGGVETIFVIASAAPLSEIDEVLEKTPRATRQDERRAPPEQEEEGGERPAAGKSATGTSALDNSDSAAELRGITSASPSSHGQDATPQLRRLGGLFERISGETAARSGIWTWQITLQNAGE